MIIYIVTGNWEYEGHENIAGFTTREAAEAHAIEVEESDSYDYIDIEELEVFED